MQIYWQYPLGALAWPESGHRQGSCFVRCSCWTLLCQTTWISHKEGSDWLPSIQIIAYQCTKLPQMRHPKMGVVQVLEFSCFCNQGKKALKKKQKKKKYRYFSTLVFWKQNICDTVWSRQTMQNREINLRSVFFAPSANKSHWRTEENTSDTQAQRLADWRQKQAFGPDFKNKNSEKKGSAWRVVRGGLLIVSPQAKNLLKAVDPAEWSEVAAASIESWAK